MVRRCSWPWARGGVGARCVGGGRVSGGRVYGGRVDAMIEGDFE
jgi:hypothetical protein